MNLVLQKDVKNLGFAGDVVSVAVGYARNFLIPKGFAIEATPTEIERAEKIRAERIAKREEIAKNAEKIAEKLKNIVVKIARKVSGGTKLFGGVSESDIADALKDQAKIELDKSHIHLKNGHLKTLGEHSVDIHLHGDTHATVVIEIVEEK